MHTEPDIENVSVTVHPATSENSVNSIPDKIRRWYGHKSFRNIVSAIVAVISVLFVFIGFFLNKLEPCEAIGFTLNVITLFAPSPLT